MNCIDFRRQVGSNPGDQSEDALAHRESCAACARFASEMQAMDRTLEAAMKVDVPAGLTDIDALLARANATESAAVPARTPRMWFALAATVLLGVGVAGGLLLGQSRDTLSGELVAHVLHEPYSLSADRPTLEFSRVSSVLERGQVELKGSLGDVRYAGLCPFRGKTVPHLVIRGESGPVTIMLLPEEQVSERTPFNEEGFEGIIVPAGRGSIAIIGTEGEQLEPVHDNVSRNVEFSI